MTGEVDIANLALGRIKAGSIPDFDDDSTEAMEAARLYPICRDYVLADFPWRVNTRLQTLAVLTNDRPDDWGYLYQRPTCLRVRHILEETGRYDPNKLIPLEENADGIYCDVENARGIILTQVTDTTRFSPALISCIAWRLAYELVGPLEADGPLMQWADRKYEIEKNRAWGTDAAECIQVYAADINNGGALQRMPASISCRD